MSDGKLPLSFSAETLKEVKQLLRGSDPNAPLVDRLRNPPTPYSPALLREEAAGRIEELEAEVTRLRGALKEIANYKLSAPKRNFSGPNPWDELDATVPASEAEYMISVACDAIASTHGLKGEPK